MPWFRRLRRWLRPAPPRHFAGLPVSWLITSAGTYREYAALACSFEAADTRLYRIAVGEQDLIWSFGHPGMRHEGEAFPTDAVADFLAAVKSVDILEAHLLAQDLETLVAREYERLIEPARSQRV